MIGYNLIRYTYGIAAIVVGLDKISMNYLTNWAQYVNVSLIQAASLQLSTVLMLAGIAEIAVGILVILKPRIGGAIAVAWLGLIIFNLVSMGMFYDIAARDLLIAVGFAQLVLN